MNKKHRRHIKRLASKYDITLFEAIKLFYGEKESINKNVVYSIYKKRNKGKVGKFKSTKKKKRVKVKKQVLSKPSQSDIINSC